MIMDIFEHGAVIRWTEAFVFAWVIGEWIVFETLTKTSPETETATP